MRPALSRFPYGFPDERMDPKLKRIPAPEIPSRKSKHISEAGTRS